MRIQILILGFKGLMLTAWVHRTHPLEQRLDKTLKVVLPIGAHVFVVLDL